MNLDLVYTDSDFFRVRLFVVYEQFETAFRRVIQRFLVRKW